MDKIVIENIRPWDGAYELDLDGQPLTTLEWRFIKRISGYLPMTIGDGMAGGDPDVVCALAVVALVRAGRVEKEQAISVADRLADAPFDGAAIRYVGEADAVDDVPPPMAATAPPTPSGGGSSSLTSDHQDSSQSLTGVPV